MSEEIQETPQEEVVEAPQIEAEAEVQEAEQAEPAPQWSEDAEAEARKYGWRDKSEYDLAPSGWVDPERFLELPSTQNKQLRDGLKALQEDLAKRDEKISGLERATKAAVENTRQQMQERYESQMRAIAARQRQAVETADTEEYERMERAKQQLRPPNLQPMPEEDPIAPFAKEHDWVSDPILRAEGGKIVDLGYKSGQLKQGATVQEQIAFAETYIRQQFPGRFQPATPAPPPAPKQTASRTDPGGLGALPMGRKGAGDLDAGTLAIAKELVAEGVFKNVDAYAKAYFSEDNQ